MEIQLVGISQPKPAQSILGYFIICNKNIGISNTLRYYFSMKVYCDDSDEWAFPQTGKYLLPLIKICPAFFDLQKQ